MVFLLCRQAFCTHFAVLVGVPIVTVDSLVCVYVTIEQ